MWKLQKLGDGKFVILALSGRIQAEELTELQRVLASEAGDQSASLDLKEVRLVDQDAVVFLADCEARGARLLNCPSYIREWITRVRTGH